MRVFDFIFIILQEGDIGPRLLTPCPNLLFPTLLLIWLRSAISVWSFWELECWFCKSRKSLIYWFSFVVSLLKNLISSFGSNQGHDQTRTLIQIRDGNLRSRLEFYIAKARCCVLEWDPRSDGKSPVFLPFSVYTMFINTVKPSRARSRRTRTVCSGGSVWLP